MFQLELGLLLLTTQFPAGSYSSPGLWYEARAQRVNGRMHCVFGTFLGTHHLSERSFSDITEEKSFYLVYS